MDNCNKAKLKYVKFMKIHKNLKPLVLDQKFTNSYKIVIVFI